MQNIASASKVHPCIPLLAVPMGGECCMARVAAGWCHTNFASVTSTFCSLVITGHTNITPECFGHANFGT